MTHAFDSLDREHGIAEWRHRDTGLTVLVAPTAVAPVVSFGIVYRVGSRHEAQGHTGATHLLEHLMFKGTERFHRERGTEAARVLQRLGARYNATTWLDRTSYFATAATEHLEVIADLESDRMRGALVRDEDLASERTVVLNELDRGENEPFDVLMKHSFAHAFLVHPYHHPTIGWRRDVETVTAATLRRFYDTYYHPDNATVVVAGDVSEERALEVVGRFFGGIPPAGTAFPDGSIPESDPEGERRFDIRRAGELGHLCLSWRIPPGRDPDLPALNVAAQVLSDGVTSRLHQRLVETNRCLGLHAFALELHDPGLFQVVATLAPGVEHDEVEAAVRDEVANLAANGPEEAELRRAVVQTRTDLAFHRESPAQLQSALIEAVAQGDWRLFGREMDRVAAVTRDDVSRVVGRHLADRRLVVGRFLPEGGGSGSAAAPHGFRPCHLLAPIADRVSERRLDAGGRLAVLANPHAPTVTLAGTLRAGTTAAPAGRFSLPSLTAAMLDRGTRYRDRMALAAELEDHGLQLGVTCGNGIPSSVLFTIQGLSEHLPRMVALLAEVLRHPAFGPDELARLKERVLGALRHERDDTFLQAFHALTRLVYPPGHPARRRTVEERETEVRDLGREDLAAFHASAYGADSMALAVVGDVAPDQTAALVEEAFGGWVAPGASDPVWPDAARTCGGREVISIDDRPNLDVCLGHAGSLLRTDADHPAAVLANACLGQSTLTSRLGAKVRDEAGLTYGISSRFFGTVDVPGPWLVTLGVAKETLEQAIGLVEEVVGDYCRTGPTEGELQDERLALSGAYRVGLATNVGVARELVTAMTLGEPLSRLDAYPEALLQATRDEVVAAIGRHLHPDRFVTTIAGSV